MRDDKVNRRKIKIHYVFSCNAWKKVEFDLKPLTMRAAQLALEESGLVNHLKDIEFTLNLSDDSELQKLNSEFMHKDYPTNVLSFPANEVKISDPKSYLNMDAYIGDIAISLSKIKMESDEQDKDFKNHYAHMIVHAILHLIGYDHKNEDEASLMENKEIRVLKALGIANPYEI